MPEGQAVVVEMENDGSGSCDEAVASQFSLRYNFLIFEILAAADAEGETDVGVMLQWGDVVDQCIPAVPLLVWQMLVFCVMQAVLACHDGGCAKIADEYGW